MPTFIMQNNSRGQEIPMRVEPNGDGTYSYSVVLAGGAVPGISLSITGTPAVGQVLTASLPAGYSASDYQWYRDGAAVSGAVSQTYTVVNVDKGHVLTVEAYGLSRVSSGVSVPA